MELTRHGLHNRLKEIIDAGNEIERVTLNRRDSLEVAAITGRMFGDMSEMLESVRVIGVPIVCTHLSSDVPSTIEIKLHHV